MKKLSVSFLLIWCLSGARDGWTQTVSKNVRVSFEIEPAMVLKTTSESGVGAVRLGPVSPRKDIPTQTLTVNIVTNTRGRYRIYHLLGSEVTSAQGAAFPLDQLLYRVTPGTEGGTSEVSSFAPVSREGIPIFVSKPEGGSDSFQIHYFIENKKLFSAGLYYGNISLDIRTE